MIFRGPFQAHPFCDSVIIYCSESHSSVHLQKVMQYILAHHWVFKSYQNQHCSTLQWHWFARTVLYLSTGLLCTRVQYWTDLLCVWFGFCTSPSGNQSVVYFLKRLWVVLSYHKMPKANKGSFRVRCELWYVLAPVRDNSTHVAPYMGTWREAGVPGYSIYFNHIVARWPVLWISWFAEVFTLQKSRWHEWERL